MKIINCNGWLSSNWGPHMSISISTDPAILANFSSNWGSHMSISISTDPAILANGDNLYYTWFYESIIGAYTLELDKLYFSIDFFYYKLRFYQRFLT